MLMLSTSNYKSLLPLEEIFHGTRSSQKFCKSEVPDQILETKSYSLKHQNTIKRNMCTSRFQLPNYLYQRFNMI